MSRALTGALTLPGTLRFRQLCMPHSIFMSASEHLSTMLRVKERFGNELKDLHATLPFILPCTKQCDIEAY